MTNYIWLLANGTTIPENPPIIEGVAEIEWLTVPVIFMFAIILSTLYLIAKVQKSRMEIQDAVSWIIFNLALLAFAIVIAVLIIYNNVSVISDIAHRLGFQSFETFVLLVVVAWLWFKMFKLISRYSHTKYKVTQVSQELAKLRFEMEHKNKQIIELVNKSKLEKEQKEIAKKLSATDKKNKK